MKTILSALVFLFAVVCPAFALERPWIGDVFFYWYTWDEERELGSWMQGIHNTPLEGYYDSRTFRDNRHSLWLASEWGMTHHFMDYWAPNWKGEDGQMREAVVMRAAESLRQSGYDVWMAYYQDGANFQMQEFSRNVSEKRDVYQWLRDFAASEVWPKIDGEPIQLVYSRNGRPETTLDHVAFRRFLQGRYHGVAALNEEWQTGFKDFDQIEMTLGAKGHQRAASIEFQYRVWEDEWRKLNRLVREEFGLPGMRASFDVGYGPYRGFGFAQFARVFGGPHSYGGIFAQPHDQDAQRFIQAAVAKQYGSVFFDHLKNYYFDWDIRVPGAAYLPDPFHFDRFWVGALARHSEAVLHLSWNEWWEGSNLEPCREFGKTYCEKNLFYSTLMKRTFESIHTAGEGAPVVVILNDWRFASGAPFEEELFHTVQDLRRLNVPFDLVPDDFVTAERLKDFRLVVAPSFGCGLGYNRRRQPILDVLTEWLRTGDRRLIVSAHPSVAEMCGLTEAPPPEGASDVRGDDLNVLVDVGAEGDEEFLQSGYSHRETWGRLPRDTVVSETQTFRWTPADGNATTLFLPASPNRDHVLRLAGRAIWPNAMAVLVNGRNVGTMSIPAGQVSVDVDVPAESIGPAAMVALELRYAETHVPGKRAPGQYGLESRVCNLAMESIQWSTANAPAGARQQQYTIAQDAVRLTGDLFGGAAGEAHAVPWRLRPRLTAPGAKVLSVLEAGDVPRDIAIKFGPSEVLYVNGPLSEIEAEEYWLAVVERWAGVRFHRFAAGPHCMASRLCGGDTDFLVCFNEDITEPCKLRLAVPAKAVPLAEATVLSRDGDGYQPLATTQQEGEYRARDDLRYYGVYQFAFSPVKIETPALVLQPGQNKAFSVEATNLTSRTVRGRIEASGIIPTISGEPAEVELTPGETKTVALRIGASPTVDWGRKTISIELGFDGRRAVVLRELIVEKPAGVELVDVVVSADEPQVELCVPESPFGQTAVLRDARLAFEGHMIEVPTVEPGGRCRVALPPLDLPAPREPALEARTLRIDLGRPHGPEATDYEVLLARKPNTYRGPPDATAALVVFNPRTSPLKHELLTVRIPGGPGAYCVRTEAGEAVPSQIDASGRLRFLATVPGRSGRTFYLCRSEAEAAGDLHCSADRLATGQGTLRIDNSQLSVTLSEAAGGTVTSLRHLKTGRDYGRKSFGVNYGTFSQYDPTQPRTDTRRYVKESKVRQEDLPGRIELVSQGPAVAVARVRWADERVRVEQTYEFRAYQPFFLIHQRVRPVSLDGQQELVAFNAQFQAHRLTKCFPNFVGIPSGDEQPHFGWRQGAWVPDYATLMTPPDFEESLSLVITRKQGLIGIRQGFWPAERPRAGKRQIAQIELTADKTAGCDAEIYVLLHARHQIVAKQFLADLRLAPRVEVVDKLNGRDHN